MITVRAEQETDHARVHEIQTAAFGQRNEADLIDAMREDAEPYVSLVAEEEGRVLGHVFFSPVTIESSPGPVPAAALGPIGVDPTHQGREIGSMLVRSGLAACAEIGWRAVFLVGNPNYYKRFGFALAVPRGFTYGNAFFDAAFQLHELSPGALDGSSGLVRFHPAFAEAE